MFSRQCESAEAQAYRRATLGRDCLGSAGGSGIGVRMDLPTLRKVMPWVAVVSWMIAAWAATYSAEDRRIRKMERVQVEAAERLLERNQ